MFLSLCVFTGEVLNLSRDNHCMVEITRIGLPLHYSVMITLPRLCRFTCYHVLSIWLKFVKPNQILAYSRLFSFGSFKLKRVGCTNLVSLESKVGTELACGIQPLVSIGKSFLW